MCELVHCLKHLYASAQRTRIIGNSNRRGQASQCGDLAYDLIQKMLPGLTKLFARKVSQEARAVGVGYHSVFSGEATPHGLASHQLLLQYFTLKQLCESRLDCTVALHNAIMTCSMRASHHGSFFILVKSCGWPCY